MMTVFDVDALSLALIEYLRLSRQVTAVTVENGHHFYDYHIFCSLQIILSIETYKIMYQSYPNFEFFRNIIHFGLRSE